MSDCLYWVYIVIYINTNSKLSVKHLGANNGLCLQEYDYCQFISDDHATITYDEVSISLFFKKNYNL